MTEGQKWTLSMAMAKDPKSVQHSLTDSALPINPSTINQVFPGTNKGTNLAVVQNHLSEGQISLLAEKFISVMEGAHELAPAESLLKFVRSTPIFNDIPNLYGILREIEKEEILTKDEGIATINWPRFISYFTKDPRFHVLPANSPFLTDYERKIDRAEDIMKTIFRECMNEHGHVSSASFFDKLKSHDGVVDFLDLTIGPIVEGSAYLPITIEENLQKAADEAPELMDFTTFAKIFKKMQYRPDKYPGTELKPVVSDKVVSHLQEVRMPYKAGSKSEIDGLDSQRSHSLGWADLLFPKEYRRIHHGQSHAANHLKTYPNTGFVDPRTIIGISHSDPSKHIGGPVLHHDHHRETFASSHYQPISPMPHPLHPYTDDKPHYLLAESARKRTHLEQQLTDSKKSQLTTVIKDDLRRELERRKREEEENTKKAKDLMYKELKEKYQKRIEEGVHGIKGGQKKQAKKENNEAVNKEGDKRRKMQEVMRLQQEGLENKLSEEQKILLKEALLLRKMGKI